MKINGRGQAKILSYEERERFFTEGFLCSRDRALNAFCYFTGCRISEARQTFFNGAFHNGQVREVIVIRKAITKGKQATREIYTNPRLAEFLKAYIQDAYELLEIKKIIGNWDYKSLFCGNIFSPSGEVVCPKCAGCIITTAGSSRGNRILKCKGCTHRFQAKTAFIDHPELRERVIRLGVYNSTSYGFLFLNPDNPYLFPGSEGKGCLSRSTAKEIFTNARNRVGIEGSSSHSWRRTALTEMNNKKVPLRAMQKVSGHERLKNLQKYVEVTREQMVEAINCLPLFPF